MKYSLIRRSELTMTDMERTSLRVAALEAHNSEVSRDSEVDLALHSAMLTKFSESSLEEEIRSHRSSTRTMILCMEDSCMEGSAILDKCQR
jgi:hypothetical protein